MGIAANKNQAILKVFWARNRQAITALMQNGFMNATSG